MKTKICFIAFQFLHINTNISYNVGALRPLLIELLFFCLFCVNAPFMSILINSNQLFIPDQYLCKHKDQLHYRNPIAPVDWIGAFYIAPSRSFPQRWIWPLPGSICHPGRQGEMFAISHDLCWYINLYMIYNVYLQKKAIVWTIPQARICTLCEGCTWLVSCFLCFCRRWWWLGRHSLVLERILCRILQTCHWRNASGRWISDCQSLWRHLWLRGRWWSWMHSLAFGRILKGVSCSPFLHLLTC